MQRIDPDRQQPQLQHLDDDGDYDNPDDKSDIDQDYDSGGDDSSSGDEGGSSAGAAMGGGSMYPLPDRTECGALCPECNKIGAASYCIRFTESSTSGHSGDHCCNNVAGLPAPHFWS